MSEKGQMESEFPEIADLIADYKREILLLPPVLGEETIESLYQGIVYRTKLKLLRPYSEYSVCKEGIFPMGFEALHQQAVAYQKKAFVRGWMTNFVVGGNVRETEWILAYIGDHEPLAGCMLLAGYSQKEVERLFREGVKIPFKKPWVDARLLFMLDGDTGKEDVEYLPWSRSCDCQNPKNKRIIHLKLNSLVQAINSGITGFVFRNSGPDIRSQNPGYLFEGLYYSINK